MLLDGLGSGIRSNDAMSIDIPVYINISKVLDIDHFIFRDWKHLYSFLLQQKDPSSNNVKHIMDEYHILDQEGNEKSDDDYQEDDSSDKKKRKRRKTKDI